MYPEMATAFLDKEPDEERRVRPCHIYKAEYKDCKSLRARFYQYYMHGKTQVDCGHWKEDYINCVRFEKDQSIEALNSILENERLRTQQRRNNANGNTVWEYRSAPPHDWSAPLMEKHESRQHEQ